MTSSWGKITSPQSQYSIQDVFAKTTCHPTESSPLPAMTKVSALNMISSMSWLLNQLRSQDTDRQQSQVCPLCVRSSSSPVGESKNRLSLRWQKELFIRSSLKTDQQKGGCVTPLWSHRSTLKFQKMTTVTYHGLAVG